MFIIFKLFIIQLVSTFFVVTTLHAVQTNQHSSLTILESKALTDTAFLIELNEREGGLELSIQFDSNKEKEQPIPDLLVEPGGDFSLYLDGINIHRQSYSGEKVSTSHTLPFNTVTDGRHTIKCELRTTLGLIKEQEISFMLNTTPTIKVETPKDASVLFDPVVNISFIDKESEIPGHLNIHVDERPVAIVPITQEDNNKKFLLSELFEKNNPITTLRQGNHLLRLMAQGLNGSETVRYIPFSVDATPKLKIIQDENGQLKEVKAFFVQSSEGFSGVLNIHYQQSEIFAKRSQEKQISVTRADIISALKEHNHPIPTKPTSFVISINSANGVEEWQEVIFK